jgi:hypothetical protein
MEKEDLRKKIGDYLMKGFKRHSPALVNSIELMESSLYYLFLEYSQSQQTGQKKLIKDQADHSGAFNKA